MKRNFVGLLQCNGRCMGMFGASSALGVSSHYNALATDHTACFAGGVRLTRLEGNIAGNGRTSNHKSAGDSSWLEILLPVESPSTHGNFLNSVILGKFTTVFNISIDTNAAPCNLNTARS